MKKGSIVKFYDPIDDEINEYVGVITADKDAVAYSVLWEDGHNSFVIPEFLYDTGKEMDIDSVLNQIK